MSLHKIVRRLRRSMYFTLRVVNGKMFLVMIEVHSSRRVTLTNGNVVIFRTVEYATRINSQQELAAAARRLRKAMTVNRIITMKEIEEN